MLALQYRLKTKDDFERVEKKGKIFQSESFGLAIYKRHDDNLPRFGFIVSTKISKAASARNKARRSLNEAIRQTATYIKPGFDCIFLSKPIIVKKYTDEIMREVNDSLKKAKLMK